VQVIHFVLVNLILVVVGHIAAVFDVGVHLSRNGYLEVLWRSGVVAPLAPFVQHRLVSDEDAQPPRLTALHVLVAADE
jgi:hypothetical protein